MSNVPRQPPPKKEVALALLEESSMFIHLDPRRPDVVVPKWFTGQPQLVLQVGLNMAIPIPDLKIDEFGITCTLSFNRAPFWCKIPWTAIYALVGAEDGRGGVWPDDVPPEIQLQQRSPGQQQRTPAQKRPRPKLAAVDGEAVSERSEPEAEEPKRPSKRGGAPARPVLAAVPPPSEEASETEEEAAPPEPTPAPAGGKKKREIPPYLRVIK